MPKIFYPPGNGEPPYDYDRLPQDVTDALDDLPDEEVYRVLNNEIALKAFVRRLGYKWEGVGEVGVRRLPYGFEEEEEWL